MKWLVEVLVYGLLGVALAAGLAVAYLGPDVRHVVFARPLWALTAIVPLLALGIRAAVRPRPATLLFSRAKTLRRMPGGFAARLANLPDGLKLASALLLAVTLARPQSSRTTDRIRHEGIDIVIALDLSDSMEAMDIVPNRLGGAQRVIDAFISSRPRDRIGLVVFGSTASTIAPLTMDHGVLRALVKRLRLGVMDGTSTAIGAGLGVSLNRLEESEADSRVLVLLTDGVHNADGLDPDSAAQEAADRDVRIYTILMGRRGGFGGQSVDAAQLERLASVTGGFAYTAEDGEALATSFQDLLDKLERSEIEGEQVRAELFMIPLALALGCMVLGVVLATTRLRRFP